MATLSEALAIAIQHHQAGRLQAAEQIYRQILAAAPHHADAWHLLGVIASQVGRHEVAVEYIRRAIGLEGRAAGFHVNLAGAYRALHRIPEAVACCRRALELAPDYAEAHNNLGILLAEQGKPDEAAACYRRALQLKPDHVEAHNNLGVALKDEGKLDQAVVCYRRALELKPDYAEAHYNLGAAFKDQGKLDEAVACFRRALELKPDYAEAHNNLGFALDDQGNPDEAAACCRRALELKPDFTEAHVNLGNALKDQGKLDEAVACYRRVLELKPDFADARSNLGAALNQQGKLDEALACYRGVLELKPAYAEARWNQSLLLLLTGDFQRGWAEYEWRWKTEQRPRCDFSQPLWDGRPLEGKTILLHAEQGLGDAIQFVRYAPLVKQRGGTVIVECPRPLLTLLASCAGIDRLVGRGEELPAFDVQAPLLSLPGIFRTCLETMPADVPYLYADPRLIERWRLELGRSAGFKIGIAWRGSPTHKSDRARSIPLRCFEPLAGLPGVHFFSLQKGAGTEELQEARDRFPVTELGSRLEDFMDTAAVTSHLDLVIACDTAVAHLAGALGAAVWVAIPFVPDWRWLLNRNDSPWYPAMRLFRQDRRGDWQGVFRRIEAALGEHIPCHKPHAGL
jgi:tetratricopeptide (TPR) repeat protein